MPRVSILMPTHNRADVVGAAIQSVLDQTETDFELLVVADGCTDSTVAQVGGISDPRIRVFDLPKAPHFGYANRNIALREARGEYVAYAAHDDLLLPDHLELLIDRLETTGREWTYSRPLWVSTDGVIVPFATNLTVDDELDAFLTVGNTIPASCVLHRRLCLDRYGYWPEDVPSAGDWRYWIAIIEGGQRRNLAYLPTPTCLHFSADWRRSRYASAEEVRVWLEIADGSPWWPDALRYSIPEGSLEQHVIAASMRTEGRPWRERLRGAVDLVLDRVAWDDIRSVRPQLRAHELEEQHLRGSLATAERAFAESTLAIETIGSELRRIEGAREAAEIASARATSELRATEVALSQATTDLRETQVAMACTGNELRHTQVVLSRTEADRHATGAALASALSRLEARDEELRAAREALVLTHASTSWRVTKPIRVLKQLLRAVSLPRLRKTSGPARSSR